MSPKETAELEKKSVTKKAASTKKETTKKSTSKKSTARKAGQTDTNEPKAAKAAKTAAKKTTSRKSTRKAEAAGTAVKARKTAAKKAAAKAAEATPAVKDEKSAAMASRVELAEKSAAENNVQKNLSARSIAAAKLAAKGYKKPARRKAAKKNAVGQSPAQQAAGLKRVGAEAAAGAKIYKGIKEVKGMDYAEVVEAAKVNAANLARAALTAKAFSGNGQINLSARSKAVLAGSHQSKAAMDTHLDTIGDEVKDGAKVYASIETMTQAPGQKKEGLDPVATLNASKAAPAKKAESAAEEEILAGSHQSKEAMDAHLDTIGDEVKDGARVYASIETMTQAPGQKKEGLDPVATLPETKAASAKKAAPAKAEEPAAVKGESAKEEFILDGSDQSTKEMDAHLDTIGAEVKAGAKIFNAIENMDEEPVSPEMASRIELAEKSAAENNVQKNLSARSIAAAKLAAKGYKKPARRKARKAAKKSEKDDIVAAIEAEVKDGSRIYRLIEEVPGTPYEEVVRAVEDKAAMESRKELASKTKTVIGAAKSAKATTEEENAFYNSLDDQTLLEMCQALGLDMDLDTLKKELELSPDVDEQTEKYLQEAAKSGKKYTFETDGFDEKVIPFLTKRIAATLPNKAADNIAFAKKINKDIDRMLINDSANDTAIYNDLFADVKKVLMIAQQNNLNSLEEVEQMIPCDLKKLVDRFMTVAYTILPGWQYNDVKYYEGFLYAVMAQFDDLADQQNRALMDIADLYIKHGDYQKGNDGYGYVLRENQLKDQIYYRFAKVYEPFDLQRAKGIASDALRIIDGRYTYYPMILEILQK